MASWPVDMDILEPKAEKGGVDIMRRPQLTA